MGRVATALPVSGRLALRDLSRHQARSSAALAAIGLALGIPSVIVASVAAGENASPLGNLSSTQILVHADDIDGPFAPDAARIAEVQSGVDAIAAALGDTRGRTARHVPRPLHAAATPRAVNRSRSASPARSATAGSTSPRCSPPRPRCSPRSASTRPKSPAARSSRPQPVTCYTFGSGGPFAPDRRSVQPLTSTGTLPETYTSLPKRAARSGTGGRARTGRRALRTLADRELDDRSTRPTSTTHARSRRATGSGSRPATTAPNLRMIRLAAGLTGMLLALGVLAATLGLIRGESANDLRTLDSGRGAAVDRGAASPRSPPGRWRAWARCSASSAPTSDSSPEASTI